MFYVGNAFSLNMVSDEDLLARNIVAVPLTQEAAQADLSAGFVSIVGHQSTADLFTSLLGVEVQNAGRVNAVLTPQDKLLVGQYSGPRLDEGVTELPAGSSIRWILVMLGDRADTIASL